MSFRPPRAIAIGAAALLAPLGLSSAAPAEPAPSDCPKLQQVQTDIKSLTDDLESRFAAIDKTKPLEPDSPDRQALGDNMRTIADMLQAAADDVTTEKYQNSLEEFSAFYERNAQITLGETTAPSEEVHQLKSRGAALGAKVDADYIEACGKSAGG